MVHWNYFNVNNKGLKFLKNCQKFYFRFGGLGQFDDFFPKNFLMDYCPPILTIYIHIYKLGYLGE